MAIRNIYRGAAVKGAATASASPIYVDSATNTLKHIPAGSGTTAVEIIDASSSQSLSGKVLTGRTTIASGATPLTITAAAHAGKVILLSAVAGIVATLPAAIGSGNIYTLLRTVAATSVGDVFKVANAQDYIRGGVMTVAKDDGLLTTYGTLNTGTVATESDTMTWNFTTTGICDIGDWVTFTDLAANVWGVDAFYTSNGAEATPFSAGV